MSARSNCPPTAFLTFRHPPGAPHLEANRTVLALGQCGAERHGTAPGGRSIPLFSEFVECRAPLGSRYVDVTAPSLHSLRNSCVYSCISAGISVCAFWGGRRSCETLIFRRWRS